MRAGALRDRITVQSQAPTADGQGGMTRGTWAAVSDMARIPANVEPLTGDERIAAMQTQSGVSHEVTVRYRSGIKADMRVLWHAGGGDRTLYLIAAPVVVGHNEGLRFMARQDAD